MPPTGLATKTPVGAAQRRKLKTPQERHWPKLVRSSLCDEASAAMQEHGVQYRLKLSPRKAKWPDRLGIMHRYTFWSEFVYSLNSRFQYRKREFFFRFSVYRMNDYPMQRHVRKIRLPWFFQEPDPSSSSWHRYCLYNAGFPLL